MCNTHRTRYPPALAKKRNKFSKQGLVAINHRTTLYLEPSTEAFLSVVCLDFCVKTHTLTNKKPQHSTLKGKTLKHSQQYRRREKYLPPDSNSGDSYGQLRSNEKSSITSRVESKWPTTAAAIVSLIKKLSEK